MAVANRSEALSCAVAEVLRGRVGGSRRGRWVEALEDRRLMSVTVNVNAPSGPTDEGDSLSLALSAYDNGHALAVSGWTIDWGDGSSPTNTSSSTPSHTYDDGD